MNDDQLKKKLSVLKSAKVPKSYWTGYWERLRPKVERAAREQRREQPAHARRFIDFSFPGVLVPALAVLGIAVGFYRLGSYAGHPPLASSSDFQLASDNGETQAQHVFKQMLELFPKRVNWISFIDGKVDFSISSVAYPDSKELIQLIVTLPRAQDPFEARILIRPAQAANAEGAWDNKTQAAIHIQVTPDGRKALVSCRVNGSGLETEVDISKPGVQPLGSFRSGERLVQAQLTRIKK